MSDPGARPGHGGTSGNDFHGPAAAQAGQYNTQVNHYAPPRSKAWLAVTGAAAVVLTVGTVLALVKFSGDSDGSSRDGGGAAVPPGAASSPSAAGLATAVPAPAQNGAGPTPSGAVAAPADAVQWTGAVRISETGPRLDAVPPTTEKYGLDIRLGLISPPRLFGADMASSTTNLAEWKGPGKPTRKACADLVSSQGTGQFGEVKEGTVICVRTNGGRIAVLTVTSISDSFSAGVMADAIVWSQVSGGR
ncbi:hypothetical protein ABZ442_12610 [Streptomyces triculaminicus]|uniref:hypothetical protein n=1 Tax=Streptomyces triculaminicus TaxID=2816232 RepID=UPI0033F68DA5